MWENHNRVQVGRVSSMQMLTSRIWYQIPCTKLRMEINKSRNDSTIQSKTLFKFLVQVTHVSARKVREEMKLTQAVNIPSFWFLMLIHFC